MNVEELVKQFETIATADTAIGTFTFDDLSKVNQDRQKLYPLILMKTPQSVILPFHASYNEPLYENFTISFYAFKRWTKEDKKTVTLEQRYRECDTIATTYLKNFLLQGSNVYYMTADKAVAKTRGHHMHVDQLVGVNYVFTLRVFNPVCYGLGQPINLVAVPISTTAIDLAWNDEATTEDGYHIYRSSDGLSWGLIDSIAADSVSYSDTGLEVSIVYYYKVAAYDENGDGVHSNIVAMRTDNDSICDSTLFTMIVNQDDTEIYSETWDALDTNIINLN